MDFAFFRRCRCADLASPTKTNKVLSQNNLVNPKYGAFYTKMHFSAFPKSIWLTPIRNPQ